MIQLLLAVTVIYLPRFLPLTMSFVYFHYTPAIGGWPVNQTLKGVQLANIHANESVFMFSPGFSVFIYH